MLIRNSDGTLIAGPLDAILILLHTRTGRYHSAFFEEHPPPGPISDCEATGVVRLLCLMHHTQGAETLEGALAHVDALKKKIRVHGNVFRTPVPWDGEQGIVLLRDNWLRDPTWRPEDDEEARPCRSLAN